MSKIFPTCHERETKKNFWALMRNRTTDLRIPRSDALPLSRRDSMMNKAHYEVQIWNASCILLGSAMSAMVGYAYVSWFIGEKNGRHLRINKSVG